jgi:DivIVA domain-containing protein
LTPKTANINFFAGFSMELTPLDIRNQNFHKKNFGGIDPEEVKAFLDTAANAFEQMSRDKTDLTERLKVAEERVNYYRQIEKTIQDAVVTMQKTVDEVKATAEKEAEIIVAEAKARAVREVESTKKEAEELRTLAMYGMVTGLESDEMVTGGTWLYTFETPDGDCIMTVELYRGLLVGSDGMYRFDIRMNGDV